MFSMTAIPMSNNFTLNFRHDRSSFRLLGPVGLAAFALVALACGVESGAAAGFAAQPTQDGAIVIADESPDAAADLADVVGTRLKTDSHAALAGLEGSGPDSALDLEKKSAPSETLMLSPELTDFTLPSGLGSEVTLSSYLGEQNVLVVFYRAWW